jgi:hypothetical protein
MVSVARIGMHWTQLLWQGRSMARQAEHVKRTGSSHKCTAGGTRKSGQACECISCSKPNSPQRALVTHFSPVAEIPKGSKITHQVRSASARARVQSVSGCTQLHCSSSRLHCALVTAVANIGKHADQYYPALASVLALIRCCNTSVNECWRAVAVCVLRRLFRSACV